MRKIKVPEEIYNRSLVPNTPVYVGLFADQEKTITISRPYIHETGEWVVQVRGIDHPVSLDQVIEVRRLKSKRSWSVVTPRLREEFGVFKIRDRFWRVTPWRKGVCAEGDMYSHRWVRYYKCRSELYPAMCVGVIGRGGMMPFVWETCDLRGDILGKGRSADLDGAAVACQDALREEYFIL